MSSENPLRTTTRSTDRSVRFAGKVYAGTSQPRSRSSREAAKTSKPASGVVVTAKTGN